jgi:hypothetical protein
MGTTSRARGLPAGLERLRRRFERSRQLRRARSPISDSLWAAAVRMAGLHGLNRTAKALRLDYYSLKRRLEEKNGKPAGIPSGARAAAPFIELAPPASGGPCDCILVLESASGARMKVHLKSIATPDLAALSRSFWNPRP